MSEQKRKEIAAKIIPFLKKNQIKRASFFGSYVRGQNKKDSDLDLLVEFPTGKSLLDLVRLERQLTETLGIEVDLLTYKSVSPLLRKTIFQEAIPIFQA